ncbi:hypothetical protein Fuma_01115 [Fuerstiella marisgermanici]|uniref:Uncharacterized protein n=1 Tax=Fuerstiella marisgermanici TaxID=1891926 RepID=A0A1P8WBS8_9PLAN|nr:hypothetical protein Fuma_01115 [Fuerstiella marisgermanici]
MTDHQSLDDISSLLLTYPGVTSAAVFSVPDRQQVHVRFRCNDATSLKSIAASTVWSTVLITIVNPKKESVPSKEALLAYPVTSKYLAIIREFRHIPSDSASIFRPT